MKMDETDYHELIVDLFQKENKVLIFNKNKMIVDNDLRN